jgi:hypothetical protein
MLQSEFLSNTFKLLGVTHLVAGIPIPGGNSIKPFDDDRLMETIFAAAVTAILTPPPTLQSAAVPQITAGANTGQSPQTVVSSDVLQPLLWGVVGGLVGNRLSDRLLKVSAEVDIDEEGPDVTRREKY